MAFPSYQYFSRLYDKISAYRTKYHDEGRKVASKLVYWNLKFLISKSMIFSKLLQYCKNVKNHMLFVPESVKKAVLAII